MLSVLGAADLPAFPISPFISILVIVNHTGKVVCLSVSRSLEFPFVSSSHRSGRTAPWNMPVQLCLCAHSLTGAPATLPRLPWQMVGMMVPPGGNTVISEASSKLRGTGTNMPAYSHIAANLTCTHFPLLLYVWSCQGLHHIWNSTPFRILFQSNSIHMC